jgi:hypothetical protein
VQRKIGQRGRESGLFPQSVSSVYLGMNHLKRLLKFVLSRLKSVKRGQGKSVNQRIGRHFRD